MSLDANLLSCKSCGVSFLAGTAHFCTGLTPTTGSSDEPTSDLNNGGSTDYYQLPPGATEMQDLIEHRQMNFAQGNMFKALYRAGNQSHSSYERDLNKIIWYAQRELARIINKDN